MQDDKQVDQYAKAQRAQNITRFTVGFIISIIVISLAVWLGMRGDSDNSSQQQTSSEPTRPEGSSPRFQSFEDCMQLEGAVLVEGNPRRCSIPGGPIFTEGE